MTIDVELWKFLLVQGGLAIVAVMAVWYARSERAERISYCKQLIDMGPRLVEANMSYTAAVNKLTDTVLASLNTRK